MVGMHILYYSLFIPFIMYCAKVWGNTYATNIHCLVLLQKMVIRLMCGAKRLDNTNLVFHNVNILKLQDIVKLKTAIIMVKAYRYMLPMNVHRKFNTVCATSVVSFLFRSLLDKNSSQNTTRQKRSNPHKS